MQDLCMELRYRYAGVFTLTTFTIILNEKLCSADTFQTEQNGKVWHVVVRAGDYVLYNSESNADAFCCLEEALEKAVQECMEFLY